MISKIANSAWNYPLMLSMMIYSIFFDISLLGCLLILVYLTLFFIQEDIMRVKSHYAAMSTLEEAITEINAVNAKYRRRIEELEASQLIPIAHVHTGAAPAAPSSFEFITVGLNSKYIATKTDDRPDGN